MGGFVRFFLFGGWVGGFEQNYLGGWFFLIIGWREKRDLSCPANATFTTPLMSKSCKLEPQKWPSPVSLKASCLQTR